MSLEIAGYSISAYTAAAVLACSTVLLFAYSKFKPKNPQVLNSAWKVDSKHSELIKIEERLWKIVGSLEGMPLPRTMLIYKLNDGTLLVHSPVCVNKETLDKILLLGLISYIVIPSDYHTLDASAYGNKFREAKLLCPAVSYDTITNKVGGNIVTVEKEKSNLNNLGVEYYEVQGVKIGELLYRFQLNNGKSAIVVTDLFFNLPPPVGFMNTLIGHYLFDSTGKFKVTRIFRWFILKNKLDFIKWMKKLRAMCEGFNVEYLSMAHGEELKGTKLVLAGIDDIMDNQL